MTQVDMLDFLNQMVLRKDTVLSRAFFYFELKVVSCEFEYINHCYLEVVNGLPRGNAVPHVVTVNGINDLSDA